MKGEPHTEAVDRGIATRKPNTAIPLMITIIGIFCYLGVVLPSVFESSTSYFNYSVFDILLMIGGAALIGLGTYFWFKVRTKVFPEEEKKSLDLA